MVCHYPTGCSKWNPIEHRLFSQISLNWAGKPLRSLDIMLNYIRGTSTQTGLTVQAALLDGCAGYLAYPFHYQRVNFVQETLTLSI